MPDDYSALDQLTDDHPVTVHAADQDLVVLVDSLDAPRIAEALPHVRALLAEFAVVRERATAFLWDFGATDDDNGETSDTSETSETDETTNTDNEKAAFFRDMLPTTLVINDAPAIQLHYEDISEQYMLDGYWPAVHIDRDLNPIEVTVES